jgi:hypothetical protein
MDSRRFTRTAKGQDEISHGRKTLKGKMRTVLFLIDSNKLADVLSEQVALIGGPPGALAHLLAQGYIQEVGQVVAAGNEVAAPASDPARVNDELANFQVAKIFMNDTVVDTLGIRAFLFTLRLERCATRAELMAILPDYTDALGKKLDRPAVHALVERTRELLSPSAS